MALGAHACGACKGQMYGIASGAVLRCCWGADLVCVTATVLHRWKPPVPGSRCDTELVLLVNNLQVSAWPVTCLAMPAEEAACWVRSHPDPEC